MMYYGTSNEIELGMKIPTIKLRASNIPIDKGNYVCCHNGSTDKDLRRICRSDVCLNYVGISPRKKE